MSLVLTRLAGRYAVARLDPAEGWPWWATRSTTFASVTRTPRETSVVCDAACVPEGVTAERDFAAFVLEGPVPLTSVGIMAGLSRPLADAGLSIFVVATHDTDYFLVREATADRVAELWRAAGHEVRPA